MRPRHFYISAAISLTLFVGLNLAVSLASRNAIPRQIVRRIEQTPAIDCLALGNSLMQAGFDAEAYEQAGAGHALPLKTLPPKALNAAMGSSYPVEHLLLLRRALEKHSRIECILYGFFDLQLTAPTRSHPSDLIGNRSMLYYFEPELAARYYHWSWPDWITFEIIRRVPVLAERGTLWAKVEGLRRRFSALGMPMQPTNQFGRVADFAALEARSEADLVRECEQAVSNGKLSEPVLDMIRLAKQHGGRVIIIEMPMHSSHLQRYYTTAAWQRYREYIKQLLHAEGASFIQAGDWIPEDQYFSDHIHLNTHGAIIFSQKLASVTSNSQTNLISPTPNLEQRSICR